MNVAVIGGHKCSQEIGELAKELGGLIAQEGWILVCGGLSGVMEAACQGAKDKGGTTLGILPGSDSAEANNYVDIKVPTGLGYARNVLVVRAADAVIAVNGREGTLSEIAFSLCEGKKVYGLQTWDLEGIIKVASPKEAIAKIKQDQKDA